MDDNKILYLQFPLCIQAKPGMYISSTGREGLNVILREICDNSTDEVGAGYGNTVHISNNLEGYCYVADDSSRGMPIRMSADVPDRTEAYLSISELHTSGKFQVGDIGRVGTHGVGSSAVNALSSVYALLVRVTEQNYKGSIPEVEKAWNEVGPRQRGELYYVVICEKGYKKFESCLLLKDIEKMLYGKKAKNIIPRGMTTIVLFKPDPDIFDCDNLVPDIPYTNLNYFLLIQQRFFGRKKVRVIVDGEDLKCNFKPFKYEIATTIKPKDPESPNKEVGVYLTFEADPELGKTDKDMFASVNGLDCKTGFHVNLAKAVFKSAIRSQYKITHEDALQGLRFGTIILANDCIFSSQTKDSMRSITKVKMEDFNSLVKEIEKIFKKNPEYWDLHFEKVNQFWDAHRSIGAVDKAQKMIDATSGVSSYRAKADYPKGFADATSKDRSQCELFLCFTGDTEILTCNGERVKFTSLVDRLSMGENIYTFSMTNNGTIKPAKILAAKKIKENANDLVKVTLDNGESFSCTSDHLIMKRDGTYEKAGSLKINDSLMPLYMSTVNEDGFERHVVRSKKTKDYGRIQKEFSKEEGDYFVYRIMASHPDTKRHDSMDEIGESNYPVRHHIDNNTFNDSPENLMWCSNSWHRAHHGAQALYKHAKEDKDLYNRVYIDSKRTEEYREYRSMLVNKFYSTPEGDKMRDHLREKATEEWDDEELRKWRSKETSKYAKEHPEWVEANKEKALISIYENYLKPKVIDYLGYIPKTSKDWNLAIVNIFYNTTDKIKPKYYDALCHLEIVKSEIKKVDFDDPDYIYTEQILKELVDNKIEITYKSFNDLVRKKQSIKFLANGRGYFSKKRKFPELFKTYESEINTNHKVTSVEVLSESQDVYCIEVDTPEHNFPLACGIFVKNCEGLSAAGSLIAGRKDTKYFSVMPLRGKILNVTDKSVDRALESKVINDIFNIIGLGLDVNWVGKDAKTYEEAHEIILKRSRYSRIVIAVDADSDGSAIFNEIVYLFSKFASFLISHKLIYRAMSPLFRGYSKSTGKLTYYYPDDPFDAKTSIPLDLDTKHHYDRWKGLSSLTPETGEVYDSFYNPATRRLILVTEEGIDYSMKLNEDINERKKLLYNKGILSNPYNFTDI